jgi:hypothetical protein
MATQDEMKKSFEGKGTSNVYVVNLRKEIDRIKDSKWKHATWKPPQKWRENPMGYVYVGQTNQTPIERLEDHIRDINAGKGYVRDYHQAIIKQEGKIIQSPLWDKSETFENLDYEESLKLESWLAWKISLRGYYVWGSHKHKEEKFLGTHPYD